MNYIISGRNIDITPALKEDVIRKMKRIERFFDNSDIDMHVTMSVQKFRHIATAVVPYQGNTIKVEKETEDMYASIDELVDTLEENIKKIHAKKNLNSKREGHKIENVDIEIAQEYDDTTKIITNKLSVKIMDFENAVKQMELHRYQFLVYIDSDTKKLNIIYKNGANKICVSEIDV